jgi:hypothetical protein
MTRPYIFFPFSHISKEQLETLLAFFPCFYFFPAASDIEDSKYLQKYVDNGKIVPIFSEKEHTAEAERAFKNYQTWADIYKGSQIHLKTLFSDNPYFTSDTDVLAIKSQLTENNINKDHDQETPMTLLHKALLFLKIAKRYDAEQENIDREFTQIAKADEDMISGLLGSDSSANTKKPEKNESAYDPGEIMPRERIESFLRCITALPFIRKQEENPIWITTSEALVSYLKLICTNSINTLDINPIKVHEKNCENKAEWQRQISELINFAAEHKTDMKNVLQGKKPTGDLIAAGDGCSLYGRIRIIHFFGEIINTMFNLKDEHLVVCLVRLAPKNCIRLF